MGKRKQSHCRRGHELSGDNVGVRTDGTRWCKTCDRMRPHHEQIGDTPRYVPWTTKDITTLKEQYPTGNTRELAAMLGRSPGVVKMYASRLGIKKEL